MARQYYRGQQEQYKFDHIALQVAKKIQSTPREYDKYKTIEKLFVIMPYMHSEKVEDCEKSVQLIEQLKNQAEDNHYDQVAK